MAEIPSQVPEPLRKELEDAARKGLDKLKEHLEQKSNEWKEIPLNIAITGSAGAGKSSFINALRGVTAEDEGGADVGVVETTREVTRYKHPNNHCFVFWDHPGVGTPTFPRDTYLKDVNFELFDFFLIMSSARFTEDDALLANKILKLNKRFHFVRTHIDVAIENHKKSHPRNPPTIEEVKDKIRKDCTNNLEKEGLTPCKVFLIDNYAPMNFDFPDLADTLIEEFPVNKRESLVLSITILTEKVLEKKIETLNSRIYEVSLFSALAAAIPVPGIGAAVDCAILLNEINLYKSELGLDCNSMDKTARHLKTDVEELKKKLSLKSFKLARTAKDLLQTMSALACSEATEKVLPIALPLIGSLVAAGVSYGVSVASLKYLLKCCSDDARKINQELMKGIVK